MTKDFFHCFLLYLIISACTPASEFPAFDPPDVGVLVLDSSHLSIEVMADSLDVPWNISWGPDNQLWFTEQRGTINKLEPTTGKITSLLQLQDIHFEKSRGLFGMVFHPDFETTPLVFFHYTYKIIEEGDTLIKSRLVRYRLNEKKTTLEFDKTLLDNIPGATYHNGSRLLMSKDGKLILSTGDAGKPRLSQKKEIISGKILRINLDGSIPDDNPDPESFVYAMGLRNTQGLTYGKKNLIYGSEHGPNNDDEINIIEAGNNYGWPQVEGYCNTENESRFCQEYNITEPVRAWTPTIAPAGLTFYDHHAIPEWNNSLIMGTLKGKSLRILFLDEGGRKILSEKIYLQNIVGRIRDVCVTPDGDVYLSTSNHDWHPKFNPSMYDSFPTPTDDRILRLRVIKNKQSPESYGRILREDTIPLQLNSIDGVIINQGNSKGLYLQHCASCHLADGKGIPGLIPPLEATTWVSGDKKRLISLVLTGLSEKIEVNGQTYQQEMPGFNALLNDKEISSILTYIRQNFKNNSSPVSPAEVNSIRTQQ